MARPLLEVADVFRAHGAAWRKANAGHVSLAQLKVMSAIETCRTAALGGHVERCEDCAHERDRLQFLPQPPLPEVPGRGGAAMARRARGGAAAGSLLSRRLHPAGVDRRHRVPEQGGRLRPPVQDRRRDADHHRRRPEASRRAHRPHRRPPHLGLGADPSSARPRHRSRRRPVAGRVALDRLQARLLPARARPLAPVPPPFPRRPRRAARGRPPHLPRRPRPARRQAAPSTPRSRRCAAPNGWSTPSGPSPDRRPSSPISPATPTASRSRTPGSSRSTRRASPSNGRTTGSKAATGSRP